MTTIYNINEFTLLPFLASTLQGHKPIVLAVDALFPPIRRLLEPLVNRVIATGRARWIVDYIPKQKALWKYPTRTFLNDVFGQTEDWHNQYFDLDHADKLAPAYGCAFKHITCNYMKPLHFHVLLLGAALEKSNGTDLRVYGLTPEVVGLFEAYWNRSLPQNWKTVWLPNKVLNFFMMLPILVFSILWALTRTRVHVKPELFFFAADYYEDVRDIHLYHEVADGGPLLLVLRHPRRQRIEPYDELLPYTSCSCRDGRFKPLAAIAASAMIVRDSIRLFRRLGGVRPALYYQVAALPFRRAVLRAFFSRFRPKFYWGRDDYNVEHVLRRQELNRIGGVSLGISHGYPAYASIFPMTRYVNFDQYFVFGHRLCEPYIHKTWPEDMSINAVGSFGASREDYAVRVLQKPKNIIVFLSMLSRDVGMIDMVRGLSKAFSDRRIILHVKSLFLQTREGQEYVADCKKGLSNVVENSETLFQIFRQAQYAFSEPSTVVIEALQFGLHSFCLDTLPIHKVCIFRDYPGLCVSSPEDSIARINAIEAGTWVYPRKSYGDVIDLSGRVLFDVVRETVGLPAKEQPLLLPDVC